jgi:hypothetical protein
MRKALFAALTPSTRALPGCIFAIGSGKGDKDDGIFSSECCDNCQQMLHVEHRLSVIEHHLKGDCKPDCPFCKKPDAAAEGKPAAEAKPAAK